MEAPEEVRKLCIQILQISKLFARPFKREISECFHDMEGTFNSNVRRSSREPNVVTDDFLEYPQMENLKLLRFLAFLKSAVRKNFLLRRLPECIDEICRSFCPTCANGPTV